MGAHIPSGHVCAFKANVLEDAYMTTHQQLLRKFKNISRVLTRTSGMEIVFHGSMASHVPGKIVLPMGDFSNDDFITMSLGYCDHELGHENYTNSNWYSIAHNKSQYLKGLLNSLDDAHQERHLMAEFKGCRKTLNNLVLLCIDKGLFPEPDAKFPEPMVLKVWLLYGARVLIGNPLNGFYQQVDILLKDKFGDDFYRKAHSIFNEAIFQSMDSTEKCFNVAEKLYLLFLDWVDQQEDQDDPSDSDDADGSDENSDQSTSSKTSKRKQEILDSLEEEIDDFHEKLRNELEAMAEGFDGSMVNALMLRSDDLSERTTYSDSYYNVEEHCHRLISGLKNPLKRVFHDQNYHHVSLDKKGRAISSSRLTSVVTGNKRIFEQETIGRSPNSAVALLVDKSGSMNAEDMSMASSVAYSMSVALDGIRGVTNMVGYYPSVGGSEENPNYDEQFLKVVKPFETRPKKDSFNIISNGDTPTAEAVTSACALLINRPEPRKLLFVITDGAANCSYSLRLAIEEANAMGIKVFGIGINRVVQGFGEADFSVIHNSSELVNALTKGLKHAFK